MSSRTTRNFLLVALLLLSLSVLHTTTHANTSAVFNVRSFGAKGDGVALDSPAVDNAIAAAAAAGGGIVEVPAGNYLCGSIHMKSNITLDLDAGATIVAAPYQNTDIYDLPEDNPTAGAYQDWGHSHFHNSLIWGENLDNVCIEGSGRIFGEGLVRGDDHPVGTANKSICLKLCRNVTLRDFTIQHGGWFGILALGDDNMTIDNLKIDTNRDGMDIDCCRNVHVVNCIVNSPIDDGICLKSTYGLGYARATENVTISNCVVSGFDEGSVLNATYTNTDKQNIHNGRIKFGTESNGGFINITVSNCIFEDCAGFALESVDGGLLEDVTISNVTMRDIVSAPLFIRLGGRMRAPVGTAYGVVRRVNISNVIVENANTKNCCIISGIPGHDIQDVTLSNIQIWYQGGGTAADANLSPAEGVTDYPDPTRWGTMPSYGIYVRHVDGITFDNVHLHTLTPDARPAILFDDVKNSSSFATEGVPTAKLVPQIGR